MISPGEALSAAVASGLIWSYVFQQEADFKKNHISIPFNAVSKCGAEKTIPALAEIIEDGRAGAVNIKVKEDGECDFTFVPVVSEPEPFG